MVNTIDKTLKYLSIKAVIGLPYFLIKNATKKNLADLLIVEAITNIGKLILNAPAEMVIILNGIGVKPAVNTIKKLYRSNFCCIAVNSSVENPGIWLKKNNATLEYSPILFHQAKYPIA